MSTNSKIAIKICTGTLCHVMGGSELPELAHHLPEHIKSKVEIKGMVCGQYCKDSSKKPPFVTVNDELIEQASIEKIINYIEKALSNDTK
ncbi:MAG: NAD(P)H-dependent oxidoreductase subunit E [Bacteroidales bacterium]